MMQDLRSRRTYEKYLKYIEKRTAGLIENTCRLCELEPIKDFKYWKIITNEYPWDMIAKTHHKITPKRHVIYGKLNKKEREEFDKIKESFIEKDYELIVEASTRKKSIPDHFHIHLMNLKDSLHRK